jgi:hypothetical protein
MIQLIGKRRGWSSRTACPWRLRQYYRPKRRQLFKSRRGVTSQQTWIFSSAPGDTTAVVAFRCSRCVLCTLSFLDAFTKLRKKRLASSRLSVRPHGTTRLPLDGFSLNLICEYFSKISHQNLTRLHEAVCTFITISRSVHLRMRNYLDKICKGNAYFMFRDVFQNLAV